MSGDYQFDADNTPVEADSNHQRAVQTTQIDPNKLWHRAGRMAKDGGSIYRTLIRCERAFSSDDFSFASH